MDSGEILAQSAATVWAIDPNWVLNGITAIAAFLFWSQMKDMKEILKDVNNLVMLHDKEIARLKDKVGLE